MALYSETVSVTYTGNGSVTEYAVPFLFYASEDLYVRVGGVLQTEGLHYEVTGEGEDPPTGEVSFTTAPGSGVAVVITREVPYTQERDLSAAGNFSPETHEQALDRLTMQTQQLAADLDELGDGGLIQDLIDAVGGAGDISTLITNIQNQLNDLETDLTALIARVTQAEADIDALQAADIALDGRLDTAEAEIDALQALAHPAASFGVVGGTPNANGASIVPATQVITLQPADANNPGLLSAVGQVIGGAKTFADLVTTGPRSLGRSTVLASGTAPNSDVILANATAGTIILTLPSAVASPGRRFIVKKTDSSSNSVAVATSLGQTIDGASGVTISSQYESVIFVSDGANWFTLGRDIAATTSRVGHVTTGTQSFAGRKTFSDLVSNGRTSATTIFTASSGTPSLTLTTIMEVVLVNASANDATIVLPSAATNAGRRYYIKRTDAGANFVTIDPTGAETIDGQSTVTLGSQYDSLQVVSNGTSWLVIDNGLPATATRSGIVTATAQNFAGQKNFGDDVNFRGGVTLDQTDGSSDSGAFPEIEFYETDWSARLLVTFGGSSLTAGSQCQLVQWGGFLVWASNCYYDSDLVDAIPVGFKAISIGTCYLRAFSPSTGWRSFTYAATAVNEKFLPDFTAATASTGAGCHEVWKNVASFSGAWVSYDGGAAHNAPGYMKDIGGRVWLRGLVRSGAVGTIFTLPAGFRPLKRNIYATAGNDLFAVLAVNADGTVALSVGSGTTYLSLDGISFPTN